MVPVMVIIVVKYRLVYQLIGRSQAAKSCLGGSTVPAAVVIVVKHSELNLSIGHWIAGVQARQLSDSGSSTVRASGGDSG